MDFTGQALAQSLYTSLIIIFCIIAWILGTAYEDYNVAWQIWLVGSIITFIVVIPSWPCFNRNPLKWQPVASKSLSSESTETSKK